MTSPPIRPDPAPFATVALSSARAGTAAGVPATVQSQVLFGSKQEIWIDHQGETYRLRITKSGKLILTK